ncbi:hypothetical protein NDU88_002564 [Pleurodeles waltl]|uniref:Uncharacterized protein n=1 Tax=Pleurodeles waltl TaxID=8319 RepID=A0AAV7WLL2_PLEWA|nr:hypothetical protein NDU88_002564 [Pleurodeles waltl]
MAGTGAVGPLGAPALPLQTVKIATGATAPVAPLQLHRLHSEPASSLQGLSRWAGGRPFGGRPPAQRESWNDRGGCGHSAVTAWRAATAARRGQNDRLCV